MADEFIKDINKELPEIFSLTEEEQMELDIRKQDDCEQIRIHALHEVGTPRKALIIRSIKLGKQVVSIDKYYVLKDADEIIGYQRAGDDKVIQNYSEIIPVVALNVVGTRLRSE